MAAKLNHWKDGLLICRCCLKEKDENLFPPDKREKYRNFKNRECRHCLNKRGEIRRNSKKDDLDFYLKRLLYGITHKLTTTKKNCKKYKSFSCNIKIEQLKDLWMKQKGKCAISGINMTHLTGEGRVIYNASIDRINSELGYTIDNIQLTCTIVNSMKSNLENDEFIKICKTVVKWQE